MLNSIFSITKLMVRSEFMRTLVYMYLCRTYINNFANPCVAVSSRTLYIFVIPGVNIYSILDGSL